MIQVDGLTFAYGGAGPVLSGLSASFPPGSLTVVSGESGSGKSTLLYLMGMMLTPSRGRIVWDGRDVSALPDWERSSLRATKVGFVFQDAMLDPSRTIAANIVEGALYAGLDPRAARRRATELTTQFGVTAGIDRRPGEISGGQAQRVALCRALIKDPQVILADEPSGNLDAANADVVWQALSNAALSGATVVVATHDVARASVATQVIKL